MLPRCAHIEIRISESTLDSKEYIHLPLLLLNKARIFNLKHCFIHGAKNMILVESRNFGS